MPIPNWFVNGPRRLDPTSGEILCELNPPFTQHMTIEILVHCAATLVELRHRTATGGIKEILLCANRDTVYLTMEPTDWLQMLLMSNPAGTPVQGSLYVWR